jgi:hypothetical protein
VRKNKRKKQKRLFAHFLSRTKAGQRFSGLKNWFSRHSSETHSEQDREVQNINMPGHLRALLCTTLIAVCTGFQPSIVRDVLSYRYHAMCPATTTSSAITSKTLRRFPRIAQHMAAASAGDSRMVWRQGFYLNNVWQRGRCTNVLDYAKIYVLLDSS